jgi:glutaredoxin
MLDRLPRHRCTLYALVAVLCGAPVGCDRKKNKERDPREELESVTFEVDGRGVRYMYRTGYGGNRSKLRLRDIPPGYRGVVGVFAGPRTERQAESGSLFVADLLEASAGERARAYLRDERWIEAASRAGNDAAKRAISTRAFAAEIAEMTPGSKYRRTVSVSMLVEDPETGEWVRRSMEFERPKEADGASADAREGSRPPAPPERGVERSANAAVERGGELWESVFGSEAEAERSASADASESSGAGGAGSGGELVMYGMKDCGACVRAKHWLDRRGISYTYHDIQNDRSKARQMVSENRAQGLRPGVVPTFARGDRRLQGWHPRRFDRWYKQ